jgi:F-type H+-transporting ATPase subunit a
MKPMIPAEAWSSSVDKRGPGAWLGCVTVASLALAAVSLSASPAWAAKANPIEHVIDANHIEIFQSWPSIPLPKVFGRQITKFMVLEVVAAILIVVIFVPISRRVQTGEPPRGAFMNAFEVLLTFIREDVAKPALGEHAADRYVPFLWTTFLFVLFCNLLGMLPFAGSPTADYAVTGALALCSFIAIHGCAVANMGGVPYLKSLWPHLDIPIPVLGWCINAMICGIEVLGVCIKSIVLAVRLYANMFAGHTVLAVMLFFIVLSAPVIAVWIPVTAVSVAGVVGLSLLELFVAFLQAYIFVFLTALFMGMALHPQH